MLNAMLKKLLFLLAALVALAGCGKTTNQNQLTMVPVRVNVQDFSVTVESLAGTKTTAINSYNGIKAVTLAFYNSNNAEVYKSTQTRGENGFSNFSLYLPYGSFTMVVIGYAWYDGDEFTLTSPTLASFTTDSRETFVATQAVNVTDPTPLELSTTLSRIVAKLQVNSADTRPEGVARIRMGFNAGSKSFNPTTGLATSNTTFTNSVGISAAVGTSTNSSCYFFLLTDEQTIDVTIDALDSEGEVVYHRVVSDVPFKRNRCTKLTGNVYSVSASAGSFLVDSDWLDEMELSF